MAEHLDVNTDVLQNIAGSFDDTSRQVDNLSLPSGVDGGIATGDILILLVDLSLDLADIAGGMDGMSQQLCETRRLYIDQDADAAEAIFNAGAAE